MLYANVHCQRWGSSQRKKGLGSWRCVCGKARWMRNAWMLGKHFCRQPPKTLTWSHKESSKFSLFIKVVAREMVELAWLHTSATLRAVLTQPIGVQMCWRCAVVVDNSWQSLLVENYLRWSHASSCGWKQQLLVWITPHSSHKMFRYNNSFSVDPLLLVLLLNLH